MHEIETERYTEAVSTLKNLAYNETEDVANKKTLLSIAKLSMLASEEASEAADIELRTLEYDLNIISAQEQLPANLYNQARPLNARELIGQVSH